MGQPIPPGDNVPLIEGLDPTWNDVVNYIPEDKRSEFAPLFKEKISSFEDYKQWADLQKSGITAEQAGTALTLYDIVERNPQQAYDIIGKHLGVTPQQAQEIVEEIEEDGNQELDDIFNDPRFKKIAQQNEVMAQILLQQNQQGLAAQQAEQAEQELDNEMKALEKKYGSNIPEREILMRMGQYGMTAEQAYQDTVNSISEYRRRPAAPMLLSNGGSVPSGNRIDPTKLSNSDRRKLVAQMMQQAQDD